MTDQPKPDEQPSFKTVDLTPAEKEALAKRTKAMLDLARLTAQEFKAAETGDALSQANIDLRQILAKVRQNEVALLALVDILLSYTLMVAVPGPPDEAGNQVIGIGPHPGMNRLTYFSTAAMRAEAAASEIRQRILRGGVGGAVGRTLRPKSN
jgi:hypothetical protein